MPANWLLSFGGGVVLGGVVRGGDDTARGRFGAGGGGPVGGGEMQRGEVRDGEACLGGGGGWEITRGGRGWVTMARVGDARDGMDGERGWATVALLGDVVAEPSGTCGSGEISLDLLGLLNLFREWMLPSELSLLRKTGPSSPPSPPSLPSSVLSSAPCVFILTMEGCERDLQTLGGGGRVGFRAEAN